MGKALAVHPSSGHGQQGLLLCPAPGLCILNSSHLGWLGHDSYYEKYPVCPVANNKMRTGWDTYELGLMLNGSLGTGSDLLQTRSDQAWTEVAW